MNDPYIEHPLPYARAMQFEECSSVVIGLLLYLYTIYREMNEYFTLLTWRYSSAEEDNESEVIFVKSKKCYTFLLLVHSPNSLVAQLYASIHCGYPFAFNFPSFLHVAA